MRAAPLLILVLLLVEPAPRAGGDVAGAGAPEPPPEAVVGVIPFEASDEPNRVFVNLAPEGRRPFVMLLDTGASASVMTPLMARSLRISVRRLKQTPYVRPTRLGRDLRFWIDTSSSDTGSRTGWEYGLLGSDFLDDYVLEIDFPGRTVRFLDPRKYRVPESVGAPDERVIPLKMGGTRIQAEIGIGERKVRVMLDTGAPDNVILSGRAARKLGIDVDSLPDLTEYGTVMGGMKVRLYETDRFTFGGFEFDRLPVMVAPRGWYNQAGNTNSVLGYDLLRQFVIRIDYDRRRLWLKRTGDARTTYLGTDYALTRKSGAFLGLSGPDYFVIGVLPGSPAEWIGLRPGDVLTEPLGAGPVDLASVMSRIRAGEEITVARRRGGDVWVDVALPLDESPSSVVTGGEEASP